MKGILFLCVANSARSQMAEGIARRLLPSEVKVWSAGSRPTSVRPEAVAVLKEIGIDISAHRSKAVAEISAAEVDTVITLCGEEECPLFLGKAERLYWGLPDPAAIEGTEDERMNAFRETRNELRRRLVSLLTAPEKEQTMSTSTKQTDWLPDWVFTFHGHSCPLMPLGYRMGRLALDALGVSREADHTLHVICELGEGHPQTCLMDGIQAATGATFGNWTVRSSRMRRRRKQMMSELGTDWSC